MILETMNQIKTTAVYLISYGITFIPFEIMIFGFFDVQYWTEIIEFFRAFVGLIIGCYVLSIFIKKPISWIKNKLFESHIE